MPANFPLPRKLQTDPSPAALALRTQNWVIDPYCVQLWGSNRTSGRHDTFIGLVNTDTWVVYLAPCFGVTGEEAIDKLAPNARTVADARAEAERFQRSDAFDRQRRRATPLIDTVLKHHALTNPIKARLEVCNVPDDLMVVAGSTSHERDDARKEAWAGIKWVYGTSGVCLVLFEEARRGFDGGSHKALARWAGQCPSLINPTPAVDWFRRAIGFGIQRDRLGYFVRFSSTLNHRLGNDGNPTFEGRVNPLRQQGREDRDMPSEWAERLVAVLARDLHMGYHPTQPPNPRDERDRTAPNKFFGRTISRNEQETTKYKRLT